MAIIFLFWSLVYSVLFELIPGHGLKAFFSQFIQGHYHLWVLFMISGMYMITPFLRKIVQDKKLTVYFLILAFIFAVVIENAIYLLGVFSAEAYALSQIVINNAHFHFVLGYPVYFVLGYYFNTYEISKKAERWIYILGIISFIACPVTSILFSLDIKHGDSVPQREGGRQKPAAERFSLRGCGGKGKSAPREKAATPAGATAFLMPDGRRPLSHHQPPVAEFLPRVLANSL